MAGGFRCGDDGETDGHRRCRWFLLQGEGPARLQELRERQHDQRGKYGQAQGVPVRCGGAPERSMQKRGKQEERSAFQKQVEQLREVGFGIQGGYLVLAFLMMASIRFSSSGGSLPSAVSTRAATASASEPSKNVWTTRFSADLLSAARVVVGM